MICLQFLFLFLFVSFSRSKYTAPSVDALFCETFQSETKIPVNSPFLDHCDIVFLKIFEKVCQLASQLRTKVQRILACR